MELNFTIILFYLSNETKNKKNSYFIFGLITFFLTIKLKIE